MGSVKILTLAAAALASIIQLTGAQFGDGDQTTSCGPVNLWTSDLGCCICDNDLSLYDGWISHKWTQPHLKFERNIADWPQICGWASDLANCLATKLPQCNASIGDEILKNYKALPPSDLDSCPSCGRGNFKNVWTETLSFYRRTCASKHVKPQVQQLLDDAMFDSNFQCLEDSTRRNIRRCDEAKNTEARPTQHSTGADLLRSYQRLTEDLLQCKFSVIGQSDCMSATRNVLYHMTRLEATYNIDDSKLPTGPAAIEDLSSSLRCSAGVFGDPHLRTCGDFALVTCSAPGEQTYISNKYFTIKGVNREMGRKVADSPRATALQSVSVTFNSFDGTRVVGVYYVSDGYLSNAFKNINGRVAGTGDDKVELHVAPDNRIRFVQASTGTVIIINQWGGNYLLTVRTAVVLILSSSGLLPEGCPDDQIIQTTQFISGADECSSACHAALNDLAFRETCTLDCLATQNLDFARNMSMRALEDESLVATYDTVLRHGAKAPATNNPMTNKPPLSTPSGVGAVAPLTLILSGCLSLLVGALVRRYVD